MSPMRGLLSRLPAHPGGLLLRPPQPSGDLHQPTDDSVPRGEVPEVGGMAGTEGHHWS